MSIIMSEGKSDSLPREIDVVVSQKFTIAVFVTEKRLVQRNISFQVNSIETLADKALFRSSSNRPSTPPGSSLGYPDSVQASHADSKKRRSVVCLPLGSWKKLSFGAVPPKEKFVAPPPTSDERMLRDLHKPQWSSPYKSHRQTTKGKQIEVMHFRESIKEIMNEEFGDEIWKAPAYIPSLARLKLFEVGRWDQYILPKIAERELRRFLDLHSASSAVGIKPLLSERQYEARTHNCISATYHQIMTRLSKSLCIQDSCKTRKMSQAKGKILFLLQDAILQSEIGFVTNSAKKKRPYSDHRARISTSVCGHRDNTISGSSSAFLLPTSHKRTCDVGISAVMYMRIVTSLMVLIQFHNVLYGGGNLSNLPRAILAPTNEIASAIISHMVSQLTTEEMPYYSFDSIDDDTSNRATLDALYPTEFLNTIQMSALLDNHSRLKARIIRFLASSPWRRIGDEELPYNGRRQGASTSPTSTPRCSPPPQLSPEDRTSLVNALKGKLQSLAGQHTDMPEVLSPNVRKRVEYFREIQVDMDFPCH
uniref:ATP-dependent DNA helicase n=1 Tax=Oryza brachyantha TaxID=4533 RepID=J3MVV4_ORYBR